MIRRKRETEPQKPRGFSDCGDSRGFWHTRFRNRSRRSPALLGRTSMISEQRAGGRHFDRRLVFEKQLRRI